MGAMINTVDQLIDHMGGTAKAADVFAVTAPAVSNWRKWNRLPAWVIPRVITIAADQELQLSDALLATSKPGKRTIQAAE
jgi:hypothetical protein